jgi:hypothetical protein
MNDKNVSQNVLQKIRDERIAPKPRWEFLLKDSAVWTAGIASLVIGGLATSVMIHTIRYDSWDALGRSGDTLLETVLFALPAFWILALAAFVAVAHYNFKHTKHGYRHRIPTIVLASVAVSAVLGIVFYDAGAGRAIDRALSDRVPPPMLFIMNPRARLWMRPDKGMIAGTVIEISDSSSLRLLDFREHVWLVHASGTTPEQIVEIQPASRIRCLGRRINPDVFEAVHIMPLDPPHMPILPFMPPFERIAAPPAYER